MISKYLSISFFKKIEKFPEHLEAAFFLAARALFSQPGVLNRPERQKTTSTASVKTPKKWQTALGKQTPVFPQDFRLSTDPASVEATTDQLTATAPRQILSPPVAEPLMLKDGYFCLRASHGSIPHADSAFKTFSSRKETRPNSAASRLFPSEDGH